MEPTIVHGHEDVPLAAWELGAEPASASPAAPVLVLHATGFHARCYRALACALGPDRRVVGLDLRGHGRASTPSLDRDADGQFPQMAWGLLALDTLAVVDQLSLHGAVGFGHSCGGATLLGAEGRRPGTFSALWVYEPVVFPSDVVPMMGERPPLAELARKRRRTFDSPRAAFDHYASKPPMAGFRTEVLHDYVDGGFEELPDGTVALRCAPEAEAATYAMAPTNGVWDLLPLVGCPTVVAGGGERADFAPELRALVAGRVPRSRTRTYAELSHFGPFEDPERLAADLRVDLP